MSATQELLHEGLPLASSVFTNPAILAAVFGGTATAAYTGSKLHEKWHQTIDIGYVGVWLDGGSPILRTKREPSHLNPFRRVPLSADEITEGESKYEIVPHGFYWVPPKKKLQPVPIGQETDPIAFCSDRHGKKKLDISASLFWRISPDSDNPVIFLENIDSRKAEKKETSDWTVEQLKQQGKERIQAIGRACLGNAMNDFSADRLLAFRSRDIKTIINRTMKSAAGKLEPVGLELMGLEINPIVRSDFEVQKDALANLGPREDLAETDAISAAAAAGTTSNGVVLQLFPGGRDPAA